jgi:hypothetical protein
VIIGALAIIAKIIKNRKLKDKETDEQIIEIPKVSDYIEETQEKIKILHTELDKVGLSKEMLEEVKKLKIIMKEKMEYWEERENEIKNIIEERNHFITTQTMYPREYAIMITELEISLEKVLEYKEKNPFKIDYNVRELIDREKKLVKEFIKTKQNVENSLELLSLYEKGIKNNKKEEVSYFLEKQQMFLHLLNGDTKNTKIILQKLIKKAQKKQVN